MTDLGSLMHLSLIVLRATNPEALASFYALVVIPMTSEQHSDGPIHYAGSFGGGALEIYPAKNDGPIKVTEDEIAAGTMAIDFLTRNRLTVIVQNITDATAGTPPKLATRAFIYGSFTDEILKERIGSTIYYFFSNRVNSMLLPRAIPEL